MSENGYARRRARAAELVQILTPRELQVLHCLVDGDTNRRIAERLGTSPKTVEIQRKNLLTKLGVESSLAAAAMGAYAGLGQCEFLATPEALVQNSDDASASDQQTPVETSELPPSPRSDAVSKGDEETSAARAVAG